MAVLLNRIKARQLARSRSCHCPMGNAVLRASEKVQGPFVRESLLNGLRLLIQALDVPFRFRAGVAVASKHYTFTRRCTHRSVLDRIFNVWKLD